MALQRRMQIIDGSTPGVEDANFVDSALKIAFATSDMVHVNQHFGSAKSFAVYAINPDDFRLLEASQFGQSDQDGNEDKLAAKLEILQGCAAVYSHAIGASAVRQLAAQGVQPVKVGDNIAICDLVEMLQDEMRSGPSSWLAKAIAQMKSPDMSRFDDMEAEGWDE
jgi:nitrogen fixation protein NifX